MMVFLGKARTLSAAACDDESAPARTPTVGAHGPQVVLTLAKTRAGVGAYGSCAGVTCASGGSEERRSPVSPNVEALQENCDAASKMRKRDESFVDS
jgi:hypothetical protein